MVNTNPLVEVYCTRPNCQDPVNTIPEKNLYGKPIRQRFCANCGMPLILENRFLALKPLVPELQRGGFGRTFLARDLNFPDLPLRVIKQLHPMISPSESQLADIERLFQGEASVLGKLNHSQIPRAWAFAKIEAPPDLQESSPQLHQAQTFFYLVQDFIHGQNLAQELRQKGQLSETEVVEMMLQLLNILDYVHNEGVIHRDIKPSNIMRASKGHISQNLSGERFYLIDFGAVKQVVVTGVPIAQSVVIGTPDFAPPEQMTGKPVSASSDLYSLAATCVCLLAGKEAQEIREYHNWNWRNYANVSPQFADILDRMLSYEPQDRYQSAQEVITALYNFNNSNISVSPVSPSSEYPQPQPIPAKLSGMTKPLKPTVTSEPTPVKNPLNKINKKLWWIAAAGIVVLSLPIILNPPTPRQESSLIGDNFFSRGEESLLKEKAINSTLCSQAFEAKQEGMDAFKNQRYENAQDKFLTAIQLFRQANDECSNDPETVIFLNNAKANIKGNPLTIAAVIPGKNKQRNTDISEEILRGVASVQETLNNQNGIEERLLQVVIARDENNSDQNIEDTAPKVAKQLAKNKLPGDNFKGKILGIVGHFTSDATLAAASVYQEEKLVAISPTSTAVRKSQPSAGSQYKYDLSPYVFRTAPNDAVAAADLVDYIEQNIGSGNAAIFYHSKQSYSTSLKESFEKNYASLGNLTECDLANSGINNCQIDDNVKFLMLSIGSQQAKDASLIISRFQNQPLFGGDSLYNPDNVSSTFGNQAENLILSVPTHIERTEQSFRDKSKQLWDTESVSWRTATAYDATQAIVTALQEVGNNPTRDGLYKELSSPNFSTQGATGIVEFDKFHDRKVDLADDNQLGILVKVQQKCKPEDTPRYQFCLIPE